MRVAAGVAVLAVLASPALADALQILGGIAEGSSAITLETRGLTYVPENMRRTVVPFDSTLPPGSIVVRTGARRLYFILGPGEAVEYRIGVGREGFAWTGSNVITRKAQWPDWRPPPEMIARERRRGQELPRMMPGGPDNPLGARALYIGDTAFRIHGTNEAWSIGQAVSSGCIRMMNGDVIDLYDRVQLGAQVSVEP